MTVIFTIFYITIEHYVLYWRIVLFVRFDQTHAVDVRQVMQRHVFPFVCTHQKKCHCAFSEVSNAILGHQRPQETNISQNIAAKQQIRDCPCCLCSDEITRNPICLQCNIIIKELCLPVKAMVISSEIRNIFFLYDWECYCGSVISP